MSKTKIQQLIDDAKSAGLKVSEDGRGGADIIKGPRTAVRVFPNGWCMRLGVDLSIALMLRTDKAREILGIRRATNTRSRA